MIEIAAWIEGRWRISRTAQLPQCANFKIVCDYGDWSGYRTLDECLKQQMNNNRPNRFYRIVED